ncbi:hypothetical protein [Streptosporangium sp. NPDC006007]|uniref:hypothetical protein n=1 Tax=Streptosporangium sp. NPDC006007 TaxID=3154575 RepID=UPI00339E4713
MGLFGKKQHKQDKQPAPPVRRDRVMKLIKLGMDQTDAGDRDLDSRDFEAARDAFNALILQSTQAEVIAAYDALKRHGY